MPDPPPRTVTLSISGSLEPADVRVLLERGRSLLDAPRVGLLRCEVADLAADLVNLEALARLALDARRRRCRVELADATPQLCALVELLGLADVLPARR
jgi:hypothetical protein